MTQNRIAAPIAVLVACVAFALAAGACGGKKDTIPTGIAEADKFLFERGTELLNRKKWLTSREFFGRLVDNYPQSPYRPDAKIGVGDAYLGEGSTESLVLAVNEFKEFLSYYPTHRRADYAQYKLALCHYRQMRGPERDQRETREAVTEFETFIAKYPNSALMPEVQARYREARDRLSMSEYRVGHFYFRQTVVPGRHRAAQGGAEGRSGLQPARRALLLPRRGAAEGKAGCRGAALLRPPGEGVRDERVPGAGQSASRGVQGDAPGVAARRHRRMRPPRRRTPAPAPRRPPPSRRHDASVDGTPPPSRRPPPSDSRRRIVANRPPSGPAHRHRFRKSGRGSLNRRHVTMACHVIARQRLPPARGPGRSTGPVTVSA